MKKCNKCFLDKNLTEFFRDKGFKDGRASICKACKTANTMIWRKENKEKYNSDHREYCAKNYQKLRMQRYKITPEHHAEMLLNQKGVCAICLKLPNGKRPLAIDHDHGTGNVRGLLCYGCNRAIHILDKPELLQSAMTYLKR